MSPSKNTDSPETAVEGAVEETFEAPTEEPADTLAEKPVEESRDIRTTHPNGHFYSPIVNPAELDPELLWPEPPRPIPGIDFNNASHRNILTGVFPKFIPEYDYPEHLEETPELCDFYTQNSQFSWLDSRALFVLLRHWRPKRMIEVGSGFSTLLAADVKRRFLDGRMQLSCVEPYPRPFLRQEALGIDRLIEKKVQEVPFEVFEELQSGDILFIDSSHVAKTGSDVNFLYLEILPRLAPGVIIHIHDIFLPMEYPYDWVVTENRSWNEQYLLRALLMYSSAFRVIFGCSYAFYKFPDLAREALAHDKGHAFGGGSFWIERV
ncbi:MAG TPA: class I SAM-dependent methyltransferase [Wenzhouxiangellaceae bacterium]|nr:class I SAM-dependent methyltransferase [Wenzhouxiangellaceae bacterium]